MTMIDAGTTGAKRQSWARNNPRDVLKDLVEAHPTWGRERLLKTFHDKVVNKPEYIDIIIEYWFANNFYSLTERKTTVDADARKKKVTLAAKEKIKNHIEQEAKIILLDMMMPNGKRLGDCTGLECQALSTKMGGWLLRIAKRIQPNDVVAVVLSENQVRDFYAMST